MKIKIILALLFLNSCLLQRVKEEEHIELITNPQGEGISLVAEFTKGPAYNHPCLAIWLEDLEGNYLETLLVTKYVATGIFAHGETQPGKWNVEPGSVRRPATLPYWAHKRGIRASDGLYIPSPETPVPDAITAATPKGNFSLDTRSTVFPPKKFRILLEINQAWDSNRYWTNTSYSNDPDYFGSLQPSLVYAATFDTENGDDPVFLNPIGHGHPSGKDGKLFTDLTTLTTAKEIIHSVSVRLKLKP